MGKRITSKKTKQKKNSLHDTTPTLPRQARYWWLATLCLTGPVGNGENVNVSNPFDDQCQYSRTYHNSYSRTPGKGLSVGCARSIPNLHASECALILGYGCVCVRLMVIIYLLFFLFAHFVFLFCVHMCQCNEENKSKFNTWNWKNQETVGRLCSWWMHIVTCYRLDVPLYIFDQFCSKHLSILCWYLIFLSLLLLFACWNRCIMC